MTAIIFESALRSLVLAAAVGIGLWTVRRRSARLHMAAWTVVLLGALVMPVLMQWQSVEIPTPATLTKVVPSVYNVAPLTTSVPPAAPLPKPIPWRSIASIVYAAVAAALLLRLAIGLGKTWTLWRRGEPVPELRTSALDVRETPGVAAPVTIGTSVLLPPSWRSWDESTLGAVLTHERSHAAWFDFYVLLIARIHLAVFWFSPLAWWLPSRLAALAEAACDDSALAGGLDGASYAEILIGFAIRREPAASAVAMARLSTLSARVDRILSGTAVPAEVGWKAVALVAVCATVLTTLIAACSVHAQSSGRAATSRSDSYAIVSGNSVTMNGSSSDADRARSFRGKTKEPYVWFVRGEKEYLVTDPAAVKKAQELFRPQEELGRIQAKLGEQQAVLGERQAAVSVKVPPFDDLVRDVHEQVEELQKQLTEAKVLQLADSNKLLAELEAELKRSVDKEATQQELGELQAKAGEIQARLSNDLAEQQAKLQARMAELQARFADLQAHAAGIQQRLGKEQAELGERQAKLGAEQARLAEKVTREVQQLFDEFLKNGLAQPAK